MCYVGKATKIFIFIVAVIITTGLLLGFGLLRRNINPKSPKCSADGQYCSLSDYSPPPPPLQFPFPSFPDPNAPPPPPLTSLPTPPPPPPPSSFAPPVAVMAAPPPQVAPGPMSS